VWWAQWFQLKKPVSVKKHEFQLKKPVSVKKNPVSVKKSQSQLVWCGGPRGGWNYMV
jgi:hypothetical protein